MNAVPFSSPPVKPARNKALLLAVGVAVLFACGMLVLFVQRIHGDAVFEGPFTVAEEFLSRLKHGEETCLSAGDPARPGYMAAYELLSEERRRNWTFEDFYQLFLMRQNDHGPLVVSRQRERGVKSGGMEAHASFYLGFGHDDGRALHEEALELNLRRLGGKWQISDCTFLDSGVRGR